MPEKETIERAHEDEREGKAASTQAGEFVREEIHHLREGKHGARSTEQAIAIGLSKARRAGVDLDAPKKDLAKGKKSPRKKPAASRSRGASKALKRESTKAGSKKALAAHGKRAAKSRTKADRSASAKKAARTRARNSGKSRGSSTKK
jgi:hypothetical protein